MECIECGETLGLGGRRGRRPRYCSNACRQRAYRRRRRENVIPDRMVALDRWTRCVGKRPVQVNGSPASSTNSETWTTYSAAAASTTGDGMGIMLGSGVVCIDLDHALVDGTPTRTAKTILDACPGAWVERSVSGTGLHIFGAGFERAGLRVTASDGTGVEIYCRDRFICVTGDTFRPGGLPVLDLDAVTVLARKT